MTRIAVILPAYNEEQTISATIEDFYNELPDAAIWVVNNRSTDETQEKAQKTFM
ncbi:putative glucosyl-3-phosphoglycerate synthase [Yersinia aldovae]|nr:putative glucosyl-3-phosphoglycerate synthase [Yersinia aldovae]